MPRCIGFYVLSNLCISDSCSQRQYLLGMSALQSDSVWLMGPILNGINRGSIHHDMTELLCLLQCQSGWSEVWLSGQTVTFITRCEELKTFISCRQSARHNPWWPRSLLRAFDGCKWKPTCSVYHFNIYQHANFFFFLRNALAHLPF